MSGQLTPLVDLDGTLVHLALDWTRARDEAANRGLPRRITEALRQDADGTFRAWLDDFESTAEIVGLNAPLHCYLRVRTWALVTNNGRPIVDRVVAEGLIPTPAVVVCRGALPMKPAADPLLAAVAELALVVEPRPVFIGDSAIDHAAAIAAHLPFLPVSALVTHGAPS